MDVPADATTHHLELRRDVVIKRYRSWDRDEHRREWEALVLLAEHAPGLAPDPVAADLMADPPMVTMSRLAGSPLGATAVGPEQVDAMAAAVEALHRSIPARVLARLRPRVHPLSELVGMVLRHCAELAEVEPAEVEPAGVELPCSALDPVVRRAVSHGRRWLGGRSTELLVAAEVTPVFGLADGNLANYLWDGTRIRLVDFENSGRSDRSFELAEVAEHLSASDGGVPGELNLDAGSLLARFDLTRPETSRLREARRLCAFRWLLMLLPGGPAHHRNPVGTLHRQADRLLTLLG